jgi:NADPH:quinone reductase-like Zn-dependent oxidoreductase
MTPRPGDVTIEVKCVAVTPFSEEMIHRLASFLRDIDTSYCGLSSFSGKILEIGEACSKFKLGDEVVGLALNPYRADLDFKQIEVPEIVCAHRPSQATVSEAVSVVFDAMMAERALRLAKASEEDSILITGGTTPQAKALIQIAKSSMFGVEWVATSVSKTEDKEYAESIGSDETFVTSCNRGKWAEPFLGRPNRKRYDVLVEIVGDSKQAKKLLKRGSGRYVSLFNKPTPEEIIDFNIRVGGHALKAGIIPILKSPFRNILTGCVGRLRFTDGKYYSAIPSGDGEILERIMVLMDMKTLTPSVEKIIEAPKLEGEIANALQNPFNLRGRIVVYI